MREREHHDVPLVRRVGRAGREDQTALLRCPTGSEDVDRGDARRADGGEHGAHREQPLDADRNEGAAPRIAVRCAILVYEVVGFEDLAQSSIVTHSIVEGLGCTDV